MSSTLMQAVPLIPGLSNEMACTLKKCNISLIGNSRRIQAFEESDGNL